MKIGDKVTWNSSALEINKHGGHAGIMIELNKSRVGIIESLGGYGDSDSVYVEIYTPNKTRHVWIIETKLLKPYKIHVCGAVCIECTPREAVSF